MATLNELVNEVADDLNRTDLTAQCSAAVTLAIRHYDASDPWWFAEGSYTFTTTASTVAYALPSDYRAIEYAEVRTSSNQWQELRAREFSTVRRELEGQNVTACPERYAIRDNQIHLSYVPNDAYSVRLYYRRALAALTASASNEWTTDAKDLIRAHAARTVALRTLHDGELASYMATLEAEELRRLRTEHGTRIGKGKVKPQY